ncbi:unnamed protein product, partial [Symbiodinium necroappetens]
SSSNLESPRGPARDKWNFAERVLRSRSPSAGAEERSHRELQPAALTATKSETTEIHHRTGARRYSMHALERQRRRVGS